MIFIPKNGEKFWCIDMFGYILSSNNDNDKMHRIKSGNCYRTKEDAVRARDKSYAKRELEILADELNGGVEIDWDNEKQRKICLFYTGKDKSIDETDRGLIKFEGTTHCLSSRFLEVALEKLGEEKLLSDIGGGVMKTFDDIRAYTYNKFKYVIEINKFLHKLLKVISFEAESVFEAFIYPCWFILMSILSVLWLPIVLLIWIIREITSLMLIITLLPIWIYLGYKHKINIQKFKYISFRLQGRR